MLNVEISPTSDEALANRIESEISAKTKPPGSLGMLETIGKQIGLIQQTTKPKLIEPSIIVFAADHGIVAEGISPYPQSVTWQMVENYLAGGAAINVFARQNKWAVHIVDSGVNHDFGVRDGLLDRKIAYGTRNFAETPAMTSEQCDLAMQHGAALASSLRGNVIGFGEMGIGNTTSAAAIMHKTTGIPITHCAGAGTGLSSEGILRKQKVIQHAVAFHANVVDPFDVLATFGGFEIAMMVGAMLGAAARRKLIVIDGFIVTSALLIASRVAPSVLDYCVFAHCSDENGHRHMLEFLKAKPLLQLGLRLGEGTGSALALPILKAAANFMCEMATFASAQVSERSDKHASSH